MPSDEKPASGGNGRYIKEEGKMRSIFCMPSDEKPASGGNGHCIKKSKEE